MKMMIWSHLERVRRKMKESCLMVHEVAAIEEKAVYQILLLAEMAVLIVGWSW
jgi:hypothetical protein